MTALPLPVTGYYSTSELARLFNADESTIKRWANSRKLRCFKTPGGHRKFTPEHVLDFIKTFSYEISRQPVPMPISIPEDAAPEPAPAFGIELMGGLFGSTAFNEMLPAARRAADLADILERSHLGAIPLAEIYEKIVAESLRDIAAKNSSGGAAPSGALSAIMESVLRFRLLTPRNLPNGNTAICTASARGTIDDILLTAAAHILEVAGWKVYYLGFLRTAEEVNDALARFQPDLVCLPRDAEAAFSVRRSLNGTNRCAWMMFETIPPSGAEVPYGVEYVKTFGEFVIKIRQNSEFGPDTKNRDGKNAQVRIEE